MIALPLAAALALGLAPALASAAPDAPPAGARVGQPAPDFTLPDLDGKPVRLADFRGKVVVLEWFNPGCPYVKAAHTRGSLADAAARAAKQGVVWLAINSGAPGKQGTGVATNRAAQADWKMAHPILLDEPGAVGRAYGATNTPHLFVIDASGKLAYRGAVDNSPDGERGAPQGGALVEYAAVAVADLLAGRPVQVASTKAYGCSVKYGP
jgi:peroxiredoxin